MLPRRSSSTIGSLPGASLEMVSSFLALSIPRYGNLLEHLLVRAALGALLRELALDAVAAVRAGPVQRHRLALVIVTLVGHGDYSSRGGQIHYDITRTLSRPMSGKGSFLRSLHSGSCTAPVQHL